MEKILNFDFFVLDFIRENLTCGFLDGLMIFFTKLGDGGLVWVLVALFCLFQPRYRKVGAAMTVSLVLSLLIGNFLIKALVARPRPFQLKDAYILIPEPSGYSFPSGHTTASFAAAFAVWRTHKKEGAALLVLAAIIGFSRMYLYVHFFTDVLCGAAAGIFFGYLGSALVFKKSNFGLK